MGMTFRDLVLELTLLLAVVLFVAVLGPFGSWELGGLPERFAYWFTAIGAGYLLNRPVMVLAPPMAARLAMPLLPVWIGLSLVAALPTTLLVWWLNGGARWPGVAETLGFYPQVAVLVLLVNLLFYHFRRSAAPARTQGGVHAPPAPPAVAPAEAGAHAPPARPEGMPRLLDRLPPAKRGRLRAIETEDHYVRVHTDKGSELILLRMRDAVAETAGVEGMQVHRGWWVARDAVEGDESDGRNLRLRLAGGLAAPVARNSVDALRAAGWLG